MTSRHATRSLLLLFAGALLLSGCAAHPVVTVPAPAPVVSLRDDLFVVLPEPDGKVGAVTVTLCQDAGVVSIRVRDTGTGT